MTAPTAGLIEELAALTPRRGGHSCHTAAALDALSTDKRQLLEQAMEALYSSADLARLLNKYAGSSVSGGQVARHRRRGEPNGCKCPRQADAIGQMRGETA